MPMQNGIYVAPTWVNNAAPAIDADELQAMSNTIQGNQTPGVAKVQLTQALQSAFGLSSSQQLDALLNILSRAAVLNSSGDELQSVLGDTLMSIPGVRIATGSYVGTGTYGANNPCTLTFDFSPKLIVVQGNFEDWSPTGFIWQTGLELGGNIYIMTGSADYAERKFSLFGNTFSWYSTRNVANQSNSSERDYIYIAIG